MAKSRKYNGKSSGRGRRRSRAESDTGEKENAVDVRKGELELQPIELNEDDFTLHYKAMKSAKEKVEIANSLYKSQCKNAKKVSPQLLEAVKLALKLEGLDLQTIRETMEVAGFVLKVTGSPIQLTIHDSLLGDVEKQAYERGKRDGLNGAGCKCPYPDGTSLAEEYLTGWRNGTGSNLGLTEEQTEAAIAAPSSSETPASLN